MFQIEAYTIKQKDMKPKIGNNVAEVKFFPHFLVDGKIDT